jgi:hypothetical protein
MITEPQARALAALLHELRPRWSVPAMVKLLERNHTHPAPFPDITAAAITAARDPKVETPGMFLTDQRFWPPQAKGHLPPPERCELHISYPKHNCGGCRADRLAAPPEETP